MSQLSPVLQRLSGGVLAFWCPACDEAHQVRVGGRCEWTWDGNETAPTFSPSVLVRSGHYVDGKHPCWCDYNREHPSEPGATCGQCHSFVRGGNIEFLFDCTHKLAGQTVPLPPWPEAPGIGAGK